MRQIGLALIVIGMAAITSSAASAAGALAIGQTNNVAQDGVAIGATVDYATAAEARSEALRECRDAPAPLASKNCEIVQEYTRACAAIAMDEGAHTAGFGWAIAKTEFDAKWDALIACKDTADPGRARHCRVMGTACDGS